MSDYREHALGAGSEASAIAYIRVKTADGMSRWGAGVDTNIELASIKAVLSAINRLPHSGVDEDSAELAQQAGQAS